MRLRRHGARPTQQALISTAPTATGEDRHMHFDLNCRHTAELVKAPASASDDRRIHATAKYFSGHCGVLGLRQTSASRLGPPAPAITRSGDPGYRTIGRSLLPAPNTPPTSRNTRSPASTAGARSCAAEQFGTDTPSPDLTAESELHRLTIHLILRRSIHVICDPAYSVRYVP